MSENKKQFGVWMDSHHATVVGRTDAGSGDFVILSHIVNDSQESDGNEKKESHQKSALLHKFFKEISFLMQNVTEIHVTGTGTAQEQFIHYLSETPQFKNTVANESTSNKMTDDKLVDFITAKFN